MRRWGNTRTGGNDPGPRTEKERRCSWRAKEGAYVETRECTRETERRALTPEGVFEKLSCKIAKANRWSNRQRSKLMGQSPYPSGNASGRKDDSGGGGGMESASYWKPAGHMMRPGTSCASKVAEGQSGRMHDGCSRTGNGWSLRWCSLDVEAVELTRDEMRLRESTVNRTRGAAGGGGRRSEIDVDPRREATKRRGGRGLRQDAEGQRVFGMRDDVCGRSVT